jgi:hypothetical protein
MPLPAGADSTAARAASTAVLPAADFMVAAASTVVVAVEDSTAAVAVTGKLKLSSLKGRRRKLPAYLLFAA